MTDHYVMTLMRAREADLRKRAEVRRIPQELLISTRGASERLGWVLIQLGLRLSARGRQHWSTAPSTPVSAS